jgi:proline iminopeptidase
MDALPNAHRCLPLATANAYGWELLAPATFSLHWNGGPEKSDIQIQCHGENPFACFVESNFSAGIITFNTGYIFRTEPGWHMMATGPLNLPKDGISPLSGVVESDWLPFPFTMNWQFTRPGTVRFEQGEPFCRIVPVVAQALEKTTPEIHLLESDQELAGQFREWRERRDLFRMNVRAGDQQTIKQAWQKFYFKGELADGKPVAPTAHHVQKLKLPEPIDHRPQLEPLRRTANPEKPRTPPPRVEGFVPVSGGRMWYQVVGKSQATPLLVLNGGPGLPHDYLENLATLADERPIIFYDQLGCGRSERPTHDHFSSVQQMVDDVRKLREALNLQRVHLYGHATGAALAVEHALAGESGIVSLTLASPCLSMPRWMADGQRLRAHLSDDFQKIFAQAIAEGAINSPNYHAAVRTYHRRHFCRCQPWPSSLVRAFAGIGYGIYGTQWGPSPFSCTGALRSYDIGHRLPQLKQPTLFTCGQYDFATPESTEFFSRQVPHAQLAVFPHSSHTPQLEEPEAYLAAIREFVRRVDAAATSATVPDSRAGIRS